MHHRPATSSSVSTSPGLEQQRLDPDSIWRKAEDVSPVLALMVLICTVGLPLSGWVNVFPRLIQSLTSWFAILIHSTVATALTVVVGMCFSFIKKKLVLMLVTKEWSYYRSLTAPIEALTRDEAREQHRQVQSADAESNSDFSDGNTSFCDRCILFIAMIFTVGVTLTVGTRWRHKNVHHCSMCEV